MTIFLVAWVLQFAFPFAPELRVSAYFFVSVLATPGLLTL